MKDNRNNITEKLSVEEIIIEDKNGKKMRYIDNSEKLELIEEKKINKKLVLIILSSLIISLISLFIKFIRK